MLSKRENTVTSLEQVRDILNPSSEDQLRVSGWLEYQRTWLHQTQDAAAFTLEQLEQTQRELLENNQLLDNLATEVELRNQLVEAQLQLEVSESRLETEAEENTLLHGQLRRLETSQRRDVAIQTSSTLEQGGDEGVVELDKLGRPHHPSLVGGDLFC